MGNAPDLETVRRYLRLEPDGSLTWLVSRGKAKAGATAGNLKRRHGYIVVGIEGKVFQAHRVVWLLATGAWPRGMLDHIDGNRINNPPWNLRMATQRQNQQNRRHCAGAIPFKGVVLHKRTGKFQAQCNGRYLGLFLDAVSAAKAYDAEAIRSFGEFARPNFPSVQ